MVDLERQSEPQTSIAETTSDDELSINDLKMINQMESKLLKPILPQFRPHLQASEVAGLIGKNRFRPQSAALYTLLKKDRTFKKIINEIKIETKNNTEDLVNTHVRKLNVEIKELIKDTVKIQSTDLLQAHIDISLDKIMNNVQKNGDLPLHVTKRIEQEIKSAVKTTRGRELEVASIKQFEVEKNLNISEGYQEYYEHENELYKIAGMVDGIDRDGECVIEIKNRTRNTNQVEEHDLVQCLIYMKLTGLKNAS